MRKYVLTMLALALFITIQSFVLTNEPASKAALGKLLFFDPILQRIVPSVAPVATAPTLLLLIQLQ